MIKPEDFNQMRTINEYAQREVGLKIVEDMNQNKYKNMEGWYLSSDGWICNDKLPNFTKTLQYHCASCGNLEHCCICETPTQDGIPK